MKYGKILAWTYDPLDGAWLLIWCNGSSCWTLDEQQKFAWGDLWERRGLPRARSGGDLAFLHIQPDMQHQFTRVYKCMLPDIQHRCTYSHTLKIVSLRYWASVLDDQYLILVACFIPQDKLHGCSRTQRKKSLQLSGIVELCRFLIWTPSPTTLNPLTPVSAPRVA